MTTEGTASDRGIDMVVEGRAITLEAGSDLGTLVLLNGGGTLLGAVELLDFSRTGVGRRYRYRWLGHFEPLNHQVTGKHEVGSFRQAVTAMLRHYDRIKI